MESLNSRIYVDKSELIAHMNEVIRTKGKYVCISRPRRFGKTMAAEMLAAYYDRNIDATELFNSLNISKHHSYHDHRNKYDVIKINMQEFLSMAHSADEMIFNLQLQITKELCKTYPEEGINTEQLLWTMKDVFALTNRPFIILIDEWDCLFREYKKDYDIHRKYLDFLRGWLKDQPYVGLAYMTGILPIKKYGTHSALNMFWEYSMSDSGELAQYYGFTEDEVRALCTHYSMNFEEIKAWYDGYRFPQYCDGSNTMLSVYNPKSIVESMLHHRLGTYWNQTETYEALKIYIQMNYDGLKDDIIAMLAGGVKTVNIGTFSNDMTTLERKDDVLTLLVHLGYLAYDIDATTVSIPNNEIAQEYMNAIRSLGWTEVLKSIEDSFVLLKALWNMDSEAVAMGIDKAHQSVSILQYNDENALSYTINLAFYSAKEYYTILRELPSGKGFADICLVPRKMYSDKPAIIIELKWDKSIKGAIAQIKEKQYVAALNEYKGNLILTGINYNKKTKKHECEIEKIMI